MDAPSDAQPLAAQRFVAQPFFDPPSFDGCGGDAAPRGAPAPDEPRPDRPAGPVLAPPEPRAGARHDQAAGDDPGALLRGGAAPLPGGEPEGAARPGRESRHALPRRGGRAGHGGRADAAEPSRTWSTGVLGPLSRYAERPGATDLFVNGDAGLWVDCGAGPVREPAWNLDEAEVRELAVRLVALGGRHIDEATPCVDVRLGDGIRVHAVLPPVSNTGTLLSVRLPHAAGFDLATLERLGMFGEPGAVGGSPPATALCLRLREAVAGRQNLLVTGAAGSGKTTLLAALLGEAARGERIVTIEDVTELRIRHPHVVGLEARQANLEGAGRLGLEALLREALRMRPDRLVVGECRGREVRELLAALNTGHSGSAGTLHANSLADVPARMEALGALAGMSAEAVARQAVSAINLVLHIERRGGVRRLCPPGRFALDGRGRLTVLADADRP